MSEKRKKTKNIENRLVEKKNSIATLRWGTIVLAVLISLPVFGSALTPTYTGCLGTAKDLLYNIQEGTTPLEPCRAGDSQVSFSVGDITGVIAGTGLTGGGDNDNVTLSIANGGVVNSMLAANAVTSDKIADGQVTAADLLDGAGSGIDADMLDGQDANSFAPVSHNHDATYINEGQASSITTPMIADGAVNLAKLLDGTVLAEILDDDGAGTGLDADMLDGMQANSFAPVSHNHDAAYVNEGQVSSVTSSMITDGSIMDADIAFISPSKISGTAWTSTNDGSGTGLDADLLDGQHAGNFAPVSHNHAGQYWSGTGYYGLRVDTTGSYGLYGTSTGYPGYGVYGYAAGTSGGYGVYGYAASNSGYGVFGYAPGTYGEGTFGYAPGTNGRGVLGNGGQYDFYAVGPGVNYGPFTGAHEVKLSDDFPRDVKPGMIVSATGETKTRVHNGTVSLSSTLPTVRLSSTANDKAVLGALVSEAPLPKEHWYNSSNGERFGIVNALGEGRVWVSNLNGEVQAGDYITTSPVPGYGQKQDDDLLHSYTLGKATENVDWNSATETVEFNGQRYKVYLTAVVYTSG